MTPSSPLKKGTGPFEPLEFPGFSQGPRGPVPFFNGLLSHQDIGPVEIGALNLDALERPVFGRGEQLGTFFRDKQGIATERRAHTRCPDDGTMIRQ